MAARGGSRSGRARRHGAARPLALELFRPRLAASSHPLRRLLAPVLAAAALAACAALLGVAALSLGALLLAATLALVILHQVFGIELELAPGR